jgi:hypothetical protein
VRGIRIRNAALGHPLRSILGRWIDLIDDYTNRHNRTDALYWYNERATLSTFASAVARSDWHVLEEYRAPKVRKGTMWAGRADIWFARGKNEYVGEAKQVWVSLPGRSRTASGEIRAALARARREAVTARHQNSRQLGIVFAVPYIAASRHHGRAPLIEAFLSDLEAVDYDVLAYTFPDRAETVNEYGYLYPGVACIVRVPRRSTSQARALQS